MLVYIIYHDIIWTAIVSALIGAAVVVAVFCLKNKNKGGGKVSDKTLLIQGIKDNAGAFSEMYEPIYSVAAGKNKKQSEAFKNFEAAVNNCEDSEFVNAYLKKFGNHEGFGVNKKGKSKAKKVNKVYAGKARALVKTFFKAGIVREHDLYVTGDETTAEKYEIAGGAVEAGVEYEVLAPYWHLGDDVVDKGVIR